MCDVVETIIKCALHKAAARAWCTAGFGETMSQDGGAFGSSFAKSPKGWFQNNKRQSIQSVHVHSLVVLYAMDMDTTS